MNFFRTKRKEILFFCHSQKKILSNFSYLSILQFFDVLLPLITYTYLIQILGVNLYGKVAFAQAIMTFFSILIDFGFNISGTRDVALFKNNKDKLEEIISSIYTIKAILFFTGFLILILIVFSLSNLRNDKWLYLLFYGICFNEFLFPKWFFQGIEKMKFITIINISVRFMFLCLIFILVHQKGDFLFVPLSYGIGAFVGGLISLFFVFKTQGVVFKFQSIRVLIKHMKDSYVFFFSSGMVHIKEKTNAIVIGSFVGFQELAFYDFAIKIIDVMKLPFIVFKDAVFPRVMQLKSIGLIKKIIKYSLFVSLCMYLFVVCFGRYFSSIIGKEQELMGVEKLFYLMGLYFPLTCIAMYSGMGLISFSLKKKFSKSIIISITAYGILLCIYTYFSKIISLYVLIIIYLISLLIESGVRLRYLFLNKE